MDNPKSTIENNVLKGSEITYPINYSDLGSFILDKLESNAGTVAQIYSTTGETQTRGEIRDKSIRCALWMKAHGVVAGDVIAMSCQNKLDGVIPCFATFYLGAVYCSLRVGKDTNVLRYLLRMNRPKMAFSNEESAVTLAEAANAEQLDLKVVVLGRVPGFLQFTDIISESGAEEVKDFKSTPLESPNQIATILHTSGTTGKPKGVATSYATWLRNLVPPQMPFMTGTFMTFASFYWFNSTMSILGTICPNVLVPFFEEHLVCRLVEKYKINRLMMNPSMIIGLSKSDALGKYDLSSLKVILHPGFILDDSLDEAFAKYLPADVLIAPVYGMTETGGPVGIGITNSNGYRTKRKSGSALLHNTQLKVVDPETGQNLGSNKMGELLLKTGSMFDLYYNNPEATAEAMDEEGWFRTGDLGYYDEDGELFIVDRLKEMIKYRNHRISPIEIETVLVSHPGVKEVAVVGVPHPEDREHALAFVVRAVRSSDDDEEVTEKELVDFVAVKLTNSKHLHGGVRFVDSLAKTQSQKICRNVMRELAKSSVQ